MHWRWWRIHAAPESRTRLTCALDCPESQPNTSSVTGELCGTRLGAHLLSGLLDNRLSDRANADSEGGFQRVGRNEWNCSSLRETPSRVRKAAEDRRSAGFLREFLRGHS